jgi:hypothetical protein
MFVAVTSASALKITPKFTNWPVTGALTIKKLGQEVKLPEGGTFNGTGEINIEPTTGINGTIEGNTFVPPFTTTLTILFIPTPTGLSFQAENPAHGTIKSVAPSNCPNPVAGTAETCVNLSVPEKVKLGVTSIALLGVKVPTKCETITPAEFNLSTDLTLLEIISVGSHFKGEVNIPPVKCGGLFGLTLDLTLDTLLSGPNNPYSLNINPPAM